MSFTRGISPVAEHGASAILNAFHRYCAAFQQITRRAKVRFENQDWHGAQQDAVERLDLYGKMINKIVPETVGILGENSRDKATWGWMKGIYASLISSRDDIELAETFFNSVTRRVFSTVGVASSIEFVDSDFQAPVVPDSKAIFRGYKTGKGTASLVKEILESYHFKVDYQDLDRDASLVGQEIDRHLKSARGASSIDRLEMLQPVFYRGKGAYLIGRIVHSGQIIPIILVLRNERGGIYVDAVLLTVDETSIVFSFTRSYFHVETEVPHQLISFLKSILPQKRVAELYISIGYNKHGKTELYRDLLLHLAKSQDKFEIARGEKGMVMTVFTLPSYDLVFKIIKDRFSEPKTTTRHEVMERYQLVFMHDRAGRLVDAQEFEHLKFDRDRFSDDLLKELLSVAPGSVTVREDYVAIKHLYTERRTVPLDIFVREADVADVREAVLDYGQAIKDLAATNIFPGDILLKNFGVTRHGRVVFYDYDELTLLMDCRFRRIPQARDYSDEMEAEPWFFVGKNDIFPEEFRTFLGLPDPYRQDFLQVHGDLFGVEFWKNMQRQLRSGEVIDIFPYKQSRRLEGHSPEE